MRRISLHLHGIGVEQPPHDRDCDYTRGMTNHPTAPQNSNEFAWRRDAMIRRLVEKHPTTAAMLVYLRLFPNQKKASGRLHRLVQRRQVQLLGTVAFKGGRPEHVYCRRVVKADNLRHEVQLTWLCLRTFADEVRRGPGDTDPGLLPDAEFWINGQRFYVEMDCGSMHPQDVVRKRFSKYQSVRDLVLWVCPSEARAETLRRLAGSLREVALFTTLDLALRNPHDPIWTDADGGRAALPRSTWREREKAGEIPGEEPREQPGTMVGLSPHPHPGAGLLPFRTPAAPMLPRNSEAEPRLTPAVPTTGAARRSARTPPATTP